MLSVFLFSIKIILYVYMLFLCCKISVLPFLAGFYSKDFILEMFSMRYVNIFGFFFYRLCLRV